MIAIPPFRTTLNAVISRIPNVLVAALSLCAAGVVLHAEEAGQEKRPNPGFKGEGDHKPRFSPFSGPGGMGGFDKLTEAERTKVREVMDKAWKQPEMQAARDKFMKASEEFRAALRTTIQGIDPEAAKILEKVKPPMPWEHRGGPPVVKPEDPEFAKHAVARLGFELGAFGKPEQRDALRKLHERVMSLPALKEALAKLEAAPVDARMETFKTLRELYKKEVEKQIGEYRKQHEQAGGQSRP